jgi:RHS repeat-associated protein
VAKTVDSVTTAYVLDPAAGLTQVLQETTGGQATSYLYGHDLLAQYDSGTWAYHLNDGLGSVRQLTDAAGQVVQSYRFSPFGVPLDESGGEPYGFTGEQWDASAGLVYLRARYYDPGVGRFVSKDQWGGREQKPQTLNRFVYVTSNPINQVDPSGYLSDRLIQESLNGHSLDQVFGFQDRWGLFALLRDAEIGDTVTARYLDFPYTLYDDVWNNMRTWPLRADPRARNGWCIRCGNDNKLRFYNAQDGEELTLPDLVMKKLPDNAHQVFSLASFWRPRSVELPWYELNERKFYDDFRGKTQVPDAISLGGSVDVPTPWVVSVGANSATIVDRYGNVYLSFSGAVGVGMGLSIPSTGIGLGGEYLEGYATYPRGLGRMYKDRVDESKLKDIIGGPAVTFTGQFGISAGEEIWRSGSIAWCGMSTSIAANVSFGGTKHMDKDPTIAWDWLDEIPGYDSTVKGSPSPHSDEPGHNCGCQ